MLSCSRRFNVSETAPRCARALLSLVPSLRAQVNNCRNNTVILNVRDKKGDFLRSLQASNFRAKVNGKPINIASAIASVNVHRVVLAVDASGSMNDGVVRATVYEILRAFPQETQFALVVFSDRILQTVPFGHSRQEIMDAVAALKFYGPTAVWDSLLYADGLLRPVETGDSVILLSDGGDSKSDVSAGKLSEAYLSSRVRIAAVLIRDRFFPSQQELQGIEDLERLADQTGGAVRTIQVPKDVGAVRDLGTELGHYYLVQLLVGASDKSANLQFEVVDSGGRKLKGITLTFPHKLPSDCGLRQ